MEKENHHVQKEEFEASVSLFSSAQKSHTTLGYGRGAPISQISIGIEASSQIGHVAHATEEPRFEGLSHVGQRPSCNFRHGAFHHP